MTTTPIPCESHSNRIANVPTESAVRRKALRQELILHKSRRRTLGHRDYGSYQLVDFRNVLVLGDPNGTLEECHEFLMEGGNQS
jgi:hypothetical protein